MKLLLLDIAQTSVALFIILTSIAVSFILRGIEGFVTHL